LLQAIHAGLCQQVARRFHSLLHATVEVRPVGLNQKRFDECASESAAPDLICQMESPTQSAPRLISWQPALAHSLINHLLGGAAVRPSDSPAKTPSELEVRLLSRLGCAVLDEISQLAEPSRLNEHHELTVVHSPLRMQPEILGSPYLCVSFEVAFNGDCGLMHCWLPKANLAQSPSFLSKLPFRTSEPGRLAAPTQQAKIELLADLAHLKLRVSEISELAIGDVLLTDSAHLDGATLRLADRTLYQVAIGTLTGKKAVRLAKLLPPIGPSVSINESPKKR
jgi:flagellar motor switch protein FliM